MNQPTNLIIMNINNFQPIETVNSRFELIIK